MRSTWFAAGKFLSRCLRVRTSATQFSKMDMNPKRIQATGAVGFLGFQLCDSLLKEGNYVVGVGNLSARGETNLAYLSREPQLEFVQHDICRSSDVGTVGFAFSFASYKGPVNYAQLGIGTLLVGSAGILNALEIARTCNAGYLHISTLERN